MFKDKLKQAMQELNINQVKVCELTGIGKSSISQYISGKNEPSAAKQRAIAVALGLEPDYFNQEQAAIAVMCQIRKYQG